MSIENQADPDGLTAVGRIVALTIAAVAARLRPGVTTGELDRFAEDFLASRSTVDGSRVAHHEHTMVITRERPILLTRL
jgi:methionine aminopeptidase